MRKKIAIDCSKLIDLEYTGTHRFLVGFLGELVKNKNFEYYFYFSRFSNKITKLKFIKHGDVKIVKTRPYTQLGLLKELAKYDYFIFPWQTIPVLCFMTKSKVLAIIHDLGFTFKDRIFTFLAVILSYRLFSVSMTTRSRLPRASVFLGEGVDSSVFKELETEELQKLDFRYSLEAPFILTIGRIEERKNIYNNLRAFKKVHQLYPKLKYLFIGKFSIKEEIIYSFIKSLGLGSDTVLFKKHLPDEVLNYYLNRCEFTVFTSLDEGFGLPVIESYKVKKLVILSNIQALAELSLSANQFISPNDPDEIARKIIYFYENGKSIKGQFDFAKVLDFYTWTNCSNRFFKGLLS